MAPEDLPILARTTPKPGFLDSHEPKNHTGEKREGRGERGEEKRTAGTHNFILPTLEIVSERQKSARDTPLGHLNPAVPFSKIRVYIGMKWAKWPRNAQEAAHQPEFGHFLPSDNNCSQYLPGFLKRWLLKICPFWPERHRNRVFWTPMSLEPHGREKRREGREGRRKRTAGTHNFYIAYFGDSF